MVHVKKSITYFLAIAMAVVLAFSFVPVSFAYTQGELIRDSDSIDAWVTWMENNTHGSNIVDLKPSYWNMIDQCFSASGCGLLAAHTELQTAMQSWNGRMHRFDPLTILALSIFGLATSSDDMPTAYIAFDSDLGVYRLREYHTDLWLVNSSGHFPYYRPPVDEDGNVPAVDTTGIKWLPYKDAFQNQNNRHFVTKDVLDDMAEYYNGVVVKSDKYWVCTKTDPILGQYLYLCDPHGYPYVNVIDPESTAVNTPNNYFDSTGSTTTNQLLIDMNQNIVWFPDGTIQFGPEVIYDEDNQTYYVDSHDSYVYNTVTDSYNTTYYKWEYNYYIDYTSITYIGQTEEYEDPFECYYELPDGRSSADLTKEELEQLSLCFVDVINYARTADDISMRALYHFDGNTNDSSYWSYCTSFDWVEGASLTYMDEGTFDGSLYLDETDHKFVINLPSIDLAGDFTFQFRYYQSYTADPQADSFITFGTHDVMILTGDAYYDVNAQPICDTAIGNWNELCFVREGSTLYYYVNGVCYKQVELSGSLGDHITFTFGSTQQTYKKLDEMRFTKKALYTGGEDYTCTAVPYDTNLALVLPDGEVPIADEYFELVAPEDNLLASWDFSNAASIPLVDFTPTADWFVTKSANMQSVIEDTFDPLGLYSFGGTASLGQGESGTLLTVLDPTVRSVESLSLYEATVGTSRFYKRVMSFPQNCLGLCLSVDGSMSATASTAKRYNLSQPDAESDPVYYTFTVIDTDGNVSYVNFCTKIGTNTVFYSTGMQESTFEFALFSGIRSEDDPNSFSEDTSLSVSFLSSVSGSSYHLYGPVMLYIFPVSETTEIAYMELVQGSEPRYEMTWHNAVYSSGQLEDSPVLAVKTTSKISSWQIGGVRPSYPESGQVYGLVENGRITSLQLYTGYAWIAVDGRIWTGERWIPPSSFNVFTLQDFWDMNGTTDKDDYTYIYTESGFWDWWQKQWTKFTGTLFDKMDSSSGTDVTVNIQNDILLEEEDKQKFDEHEYIGIVKTLRNIYDFVAEFFTDFTMGGIQDFLDVLNDKNSFIYGLFRLNGLG